MFSNSHLITVTTKKGGTEGGYERSSSRNLCRRSVRAPTLPIIPVVLKRVLKTLNWLILFISICRASGLGIVSTMSLNCECLGIVSTMSPEIMTKQDTVFVQISF